MDSLINTYPDFSKIMMMEQKLCTAYRFFLYEVLSVSRLYSNMSGLSKDFNNSVVDYKVG